MNLDLKSVGIIAVSVNAVLGYVVSLKHHFRWWLLSCFVFITLCDASVSLLFYIDGY